MAQDIADKIVERLKAEGRLTRNTGTNSIKSVRTDLDRFTDVFQSINTNLIEQTQILRETLQLQLEEAGRNERARQLEEAGRTTTVPPSPLPSPPPTPGQDLSERAGASSLLSLFSAGGIGGFASAAVLAALRTPIRTALFTLIAPSLGKLIGGLAEVGLEGLDPNDILLGDDSKKTFAESLGSAGMWGIIGLAFGKKAALVFAGGSLVADALSGLFPDTADAEILNAFGKSWTGSDFFQLGSTLGLAFGPSIVKSAFSKLGDNPTFMDKFKKGISSRFLLGTGTLVLGEGIADAIEYAMGGESEISEAIRSSTQWASMLAVFGPKGLLLGAIAGLAIYAGKEVLSYIDEQGKEAQENVRKKIDEENAKLDEMIRRGQLDEALAQTNLIARQYLAGGFEGEEADRIEKELLSRIEEVRALDPEKAEELSRILGVVRSRQIQSSIGMVGSMAENLPQTLEGASAVVDDYIYDTMKTLADRRGVSVEDMVKEVGYNNALYGLLGALQNEGYDPTDPSIRGVAETRLRELLGQNTILPGSGLEDRSNGVAEVARSGRNRTRGSVTYAPVTVAPVTNTNVTGGQSSTVINSFARDRIDLDMISRPMAVF